MSNIMDAVVGNNIVTQNIVGVTANNQIIVQQQIAQPIQNTKFITAVNVNQHVNNGQTITIMKPVQQISQEHSGQIINGTKLNDLAREVDPNMQLDEDVEDTIFSIGDDFIDNVIEGACKIAKHRHGNSIEVRDIQLYLEKAYNMWLPGFGTDELKPYKRTALTESHKQRLALIRRTLKKY